MRDSRGSAGGTDRTVEILVGESITLALNASSVGPITSEYALWVWSGAVSNLFEASPTVLDLGVLTLGETVFPTPFEPTLAPQPVRCLSGGLTGLFCDGISGISVEPSTVPFSVTKGGGLGRVSAFTLQALIEDDGAPSGLGYGITNSVALEVR